MHSALDLITIGRTSIDLYGQQIGGRLEDMATFCKAVGGCAANIAIGAARLGLRTALITRVGNEPMGRFVLEQLQREGVVTTGVKTDPQRLTSIVLLGVEDQGRFPLLFYRENCADSALSQDDVEETFVASTRALLVTGTHFSMVSAAAAQHKAMRIARARGARVILDIDYRPNLWGLAAPGAGEQRYVRSAMVTEQLAPVLAQCDLVVGTEEEIHIAGGCEDTLEALRNIRRRSAATIVCKRGPAGCVIFSGNIPARLEEGITGAGFPVEVYNVLGAGDAFMAGFLRGYLHDEPLERCAAYGNACGAFAVSRLLCSPEFPTWIELQHFLQHKSAHRALREDAHLNHLHWATTRRPAPQTVMALAMDHRSQFEEMARVASASLERVRAFKLLAVEAAGQVADGRPGYGMLLDSTYGREALTRAARLGLWLARPVERPGSRPLDFDGMPSLAAHLSEWPVCQTVKCLCLYHPDDAQELRERQERELLRLHAACRSLGRELLLEIVASKHGRVRDDTVAHVLTRLYELGIKPDWWKLEPQASEQGWTACAKAIQTHDPHCRGILVLGLDAPIEQLSSSLQLAARFELVRGFAVGRSIFADAAHAWLERRITDEAAVRDMADRLRLLADRWRDLRAESFA